MTDAALENAITLLKQGDQSGFDVIYEATKTKVYYAILTILKDSSLAEDIMQETYLKAIKYIKKYNRKHSFEAWIITIAKNTAINTYNRRKKELNVDASETPEIFGETLSTSEDQYYLKQLLEILNPIEKEVIIRHVILDEKHKTIAKALNKPLGTITWMYQNALQKLRKKAGEEDE